MSQSLALTMAPSISWQRDNEEPKPIEGTVIEIEAHDPDSESHG